MDSEVDYAYIYKMINMAVKKSIFRKPDLDDPGGDFACLAKSLLNQNCPDLTAVFLLGKARSEGGTNNVLAEASTLITASEHFVQAEDDLDQLNAISFEDNIDCSTVCLLRAARIYESQELFTLAANVFTLLSVTLMHRRKWGEALFYLQRSAEIVSRDLLCSLTILRKMITCQLHLRDWPGALNTCIQLQLSLEEAGVTNNACANELRSQFWTGSEILRVCLILLTVPPRRLTEAPESKYSLSAYQLDFSGTPDHLCEEVFVHLQSLVLAHEAGDVVEVEASLNALQSFADPDQIELFYPIISELGGPSAEPS
ncbi:unnamed protein product [Dicrocoelium dendriticum]|nr:unnamed protein product [Dicrocoelium dendriticum]